MSKTIGGLRRRGAQASQINILLTKAEILDLEIAPGSLELLPGLKTFYPPHHHKPHRRLTLDISVTMRTESKHRLIYLICSFFSLSINCSAITYRADMKGSMDSTKLKNP